MKVKLEYFDNTALTVEEIVSQAQYNYGKNVKVEVMPDSTIAYDLIYHGISMLTTHTHVGILHDDKLNYQSEVQKMRNKVLVKLTEILDQVVLDTEQKIT